MDIKIKDGNCVKINVIKNEELYEYYIENIKIGVYDSNVMEDNILMLQNTLEDELANQIKDGIDSVGKEEIKIEAERNKKILEYAKEQGIEIESIKDITVIDLDDEEEKEEFDDINENNEEKEEFNNIDEEEKEEIDGDSKEFTIKDVNIKQEINLSERSNDMKNLKQWLGVKLPPEARKIAVVESYQMNKYKDENGKDYDVSTRYSLGVVDKDNNIVPLQKYIPKLRQRDAAGNNPTEQKYQVDKDGNVEKDEILSEYEIGNKIIQIDNKEMGRVEVHIGQEEHGGNETIGVQMRDSNSIFATDTETRKVIGEYESNGQYTVDENLEEAKQHSEQNPNCEKMTIKDIDGDFNTKSHNHLEEIDFAELATKWGFYKDGKPDVDKAREYLEKEMRENPEKTIEESVDDLTDEFNDDFRGRESRI